MDAAVAARVGAVLVSVMGRVRAPRAGAHLVEDPARVGGRSRREEVVDARDLARLAEALTLRLSDAEARYAGLEPAVGERVVAEVAVVLGERVTMDDVQAAYGDAGRLRRLLSERNAPAGRVPLGGDAEELYDALVDVCCAQVVEHFTGREWYSVRTLTEVARGIGDLLDRVPDVRETDRRFEERYAKGLRASLDKAEVLGVVQIDQASSYTLTTAYVTLDVEAVGPERERDVLMPDGSSIWARVSGNGSLESVLGRYPKAVLEGPAGAGKTSLLRRLAVHIIDGDLPAQLLQVWKGCVPFFVRVRRLLRDGELLLPDVGQLVAESGSMLGSAQPAGWADRVLEAGHAVVLVDGLDELPQHHHDAVLEWLDQLCRDYPRAKYVLTSRPRVLTDAQRRVLEGAGFASATLQPMNRAQVGEFIERWHRTQGLDADEETRERLREFGEDLGRLLDTRRDLARLATNPLLCALICALHERTDQALPEGRIGLYGAAMTMMLGSREQASKVPAARHLRLSPTQQETLLGALAWWTTMNGRRDIPRHVAEDCVAEILPRFRFPERGDGEGLPTAAEVLRHLERRSGLLHEPQVDLLEFNHASFQDYLAAGAALRGHHEGHLLSRIDDPRYHDVLIMAVGRGEDRPDQQYELLEGLISRAEGLRDGKGGDRRAWLLAAACIADLDVVDPRHVGRIRKATGELIPPRNQSDAENLAAAGEFVLDLLGDFVRRKEPSPEDARWIAATAATLGTDSAIPLLRSLRHQLDGAVRAEVVHAWTRVADVDGYWHEVVQHMRIDDVTVWVPKLDLLRRYAELRERLTYFALPSGTTEVPVRDLLALPNLTGLYTVDAVFLDLEQLSMLTNLTSLTVTQAPVSDLRPLSRLTNLTDLMLKKANVSDVTPLAELTDLTFLVLDGTTVADVTPLAELTNLTHLSLGGAAVSNLEPLAALANLKYLYLGGTNVSDVAPLAGLTELTTLVLGGTNVSDLTPLAGLSKLTELFLNRTKVSDLTPLSGLADLV
ncbi:MAG TPA: NACHT domain-containing protein, partial [Yinghuangia sp.]|nr:NACHT domain-containing protein [Yinghuangia sp.]